MEAYECWLLYHQIVLTILKEDLSDYTKLYNCAIVVHISKLIILADIQNVHF